MADSPVGIVLVSHSGSLARGLGEILLQVGGPEVAVAAAGGTDDGRLGTSYTQIVDAIATVDKGSGVLVLADLGSAVLTARTVLADHETRYRGPDRRVGVVLVDAPFVEGAVAAVVAAAGGADLGAVVAAAEEARDARKL
jgi:phosphoenolpyruvate---glycerone phosphotransferase subunit DhaM